MKKRRLATMLLAAILLLSACAQSEGPTLGGSAIVTPRPSNGAEQPSPSEEPKKEPEKEMVSGVRVVVDGSVHVCDAMRYGDEWYVAPADIQTALGVDIDAEMDDYAPLRLAAKERNISYEHDGVMNAAYLWTHEPYAEKGEEDYIRAVQMGIVPDHFQADPARQVTSLEFRTLLLEMIHALEPGNAARFEENVTTHDKPLFRGEAFVMAYFAAETIGANHQNNSLENTQFDGGDFWGSSGLDFDLLFPHVWEKPSDEYGAFGARWDTYHAAGYLWSFWHSSPYSGRMQFEAEGNDMRPRAPLSAREAAEAVVRLYDSHMPISRYATLISDSQATQYDRAVITDALIKKASALPPLTKENMPTLRGFVLAGGGTYDNVEIMENERDLRLIANWGFNSVRIMVTYQTFFDEEVTHVNLAQLRKLDSMIATAMQHNLHVNLLTFSLPGRWTRTDFTTFETVADLDLFTNAERQKEASALWAVLAERYQDIPSGALSFTPIWESLNTDLSSGLSVEPYTQDDVARVYSQIIDTILQYNDDRFIIYEITANNDVWSIKRDTKTANPYMEKRHPDALIMYNFCAEPFVYSEMTAVSGDHIDHQNRSLFKPEYPVSIYATNRHVTKRDLITLRGELVEGATLDLYLSRVQGDGMLRIIADGEELYSEALSSAEYQAEAPLTKFYLYAKSEKQIQILLPRSVDEITITYSGEWFEWSGMDVTLPAEYAVQRWWFPTAYEAALQGTDREGPTLKDTSTIMISAYDRNVENDITIHADISYTTPYLFDEANAQTITAWTEEMVRYAGRFIIRFECAAFSSGNINSSVLRYYEDMLSSFEPHDISWLSNDYYWLTHAQSGLFAGANVAEYRDFYLNTDLLRLLQEYQ